MLWGISTTYASFFPPFFSSQKKTWETKPDSRSRSRAEAGDPHPKGPGWLNVEENLGDIYGKPMEFYGKTYGKPMEIHDDVQIYFFSVNRSIFLLSWCFSVWLDQNVYNTSIAARGGGGSFKSEKIYESKEHVPIESFVTILIDWTFVLITPTKWASVEVMCSDEVMWLVLRWPVVS